MRKFALAIFILFYAASVVGLTMERAENWAAERADGLKPRPRFGPLFRTVQSQHHPPLRRLQNARCWISIALHVTTKS